MALLNPAPDSFDLQLDNMFISHSGMSAHLDKFTGDLRLPDSDKAFCRINVPSITAANGSIAHIEQRVQIADHDQFNEYAKTVLLSDEYSIYLKGKGGFKYGSLPKTNVKYNKKITMKGKPSRAHFVSLRHCFVHCYYPRGPSFSSVSEPPNGAMCAEAI